MESRAALEGKSEATDESLDQVNEPSPVGEFEEVLADIVVPEVLFVAGVAARVGILGQARLVLSRLSRQFVRTTPRCTPTTTSFSVSSL